MEKAQFKTGNVGVEFSDEDQVANRDTTVLPQMVNANTDGKGKGGDMPHAGPSPR
jgi:hypothetical protein